jgi:hypothetical protein
MHGSQRIDLANHFMQMIDASAFAIPQGLFGKWGIQVDGRGLKGILRNFDL